MRVGTINPSPIVFGYKSELTDLFYDGLLPTVEKSLYGDTLSRCKKSAQRATNEHMQPHSKGGLTKLWNLALETFRMNARRADKPFSDFYTKENGDTYFNQFKDILVFYQKGGEWRLFDGNKYIKEANEQIEKILEEEKGLDVIG